MATPETPGNSRGMWNAARVLVVSSVMFTFISFWRTAAVVLCDLASTAYYIGGIVEQAIGPAAPWFILAVMVFSYAVRSVYIESCALFIRGGVYRVVRAALGRVSAKLAVSALIFDYLLTGPISGVSAGHYLMGLVLDSLPFIHPDLRIADVAARDTVKNWGAVLIACAITIYFFRLNLRGIPESSDRALKIMFATTIMIAVMLVWCAITFSVQGRATDLQGNPERIPLTPDLSKKIVKGETPSVDPLGFLAQTPLADELRPPEKVDWLSVIGAIGILIAFGHSILAMSGEETLAQVYREVESPKLQNFRKAAIIVFIYSLVFTAGFSFLAVLLVPESQRTGIYSENLISGLAMNMAGPHWARLLLNAFVVIVGFLILAGAVNTAIIGSNGVLNRVAEDGVMPDWFLRPHPRFGTTSRILLLIVGLQIAIIFITHGDVILLGEAYAFGVVWSFVFQAFSMVVLRFKDPRPREYRVPLNLKIAGVEIPFGLLLVLLVLLSAALLNLFTKELATIFGGLFTAVFFTLFSISEAVHERRRRGQEHRHLEQFTEKPQEQITPASLGLTKPYRRLVAIRSIHNLVMLEKILAETDPETTEVVVMTAKVVPPGGSVADDLHLDPYDQELMTAVVQRAEKAGKHVKPLVVPTNNPLYAVLRTAKELQVHEVVMGASNKYTADEQLETISLYWFTLNEGSPAPLTVRIIGRERDVQFDLGGGFHIPKIGERRARSVEELRAAGVGVDRVLLVHREDPAGLDLFQAVLTMLDPDVVLGLAVPPTPGADGAVTGFVEEQARRLRRQIIIQSVNGDCGKEVVRLARDGQYDAILLPLPADTPAAKELPLEPWVGYVLTHAHCRVCLVASPRPPQEVVE